MADNQNFSIQGYNLITLLKRLEAATSRLEDVTIYQEQHTSATGDSETAASAPSAIEAPKEQTTQPKSLDSSTDDSFQGNQGVSASIEAFDTFIKEKVVPYVESSKKIDDILGKQAEIFAAAVSEERNVLNAASKSKKMELDNSKFQELVILPINKLIMEVISIKDDNRQSQNFNFLNAVAEGVAVLGWIVTPTPVSYIPDFKDSAQFWTNRILKDTKGKDNEAECSDWVKKFLAIFDTLKLYVKEYHSTGITWSGDEDFEKVLKDSLSTSTSAPSAPQTSAGGAPPPPPPPPADLFAEDKAGSTATGEVGMGAVFAELNKGEGITSGLKKVDKSQMTHKNPELRKKNVPMPPKKPKNLSTASSKEDIKKVKKPGVKELLDNKWMITNMTKEECENNGVITINGSMDQSIFIGNCEEIIIQVKGKINAISVNESTKVGIVVDKAISSVELTKCNKCEVQVIEEVPIMNIDQSHSTNVYLSESSLNVEIYSSCCTALNINVPEPDGDMNEVAISEQFVTRFTKGADGKAVHTTKAVSHA